MELGKGDFSSAEWLLEQKKQHFRVNYIRNVFVWSWFLGDEIAFVAELLQHSRVQFCSFLLDRQIKKEKKQLRIIPVHKRIFFIS